MGIIKTALTIAVLGAAFYAGHKYAVIQYDAKPVKVILDGKDMKLDYFGDQIPLQPGPRLGNLENRIHGVILDFQENPAEVERLLQKYLRERK